MQAFADPKNRVVITGMGIASVFGNDVTKFYDRCAALAERPCAARCLPKSPCMREGACISSASGPCLLCCRLHVAWEHDACSDGCMVALLDCTRSMRSRTCCSLLEGKTGVKPISRFDATQFPTTFAAQIEDFDNEGCAFCVHRVAPLRCTPQACPTPTGGERMLVSSLPNYCAALLTRTLLKSGFRRI